MFFALKNQFTPRIQHPSLLEIFSLDSLLDLDSELAG